MAKRKKPATNRISSWPADERDNSRWGADHWRQVSRAETGVFGRSAHPADEGPGSRGPLQSSRHGVEGKVAIDLFAGTGALALEALSRGASRAVLIERHRPTAQTIRRNSATLGVEAIVEVTSADTFLWAKRLPDLGTAPWLVFCSPPYEFYVARKDDMLQLLNHLIQMSPPDSLFAVEADNRFDFRELPDGRPMGHSSLSACNPGDLGKAETFVNSASSLFSLSCA